MFQAIKVVMLAQEEARRLGHNFVGTEQILLGLIGESTGIAAKVLKSMSVNLKDARVEVEKIIGAPKLPCPQNWKHLAPYVSLPCCPCLEYHFPLPGPVSFPVVVILCTSGAGRGSGFVAVEIPFTPRAKRVLELSLEEARQLGEHRSCFLLPLSLKGFHQKSGPCMLPLLIEPYTVGICWHWHLLQAARS